MSCSIINHLPNIEKLTYLELGVNLNQNFNIIACEKKFSVDTNGNAKFTGTTDEYFAQLNPDCKFDIIFIDANHDYDYVLRDFNNSIDHATQWILIHDMIPPNEEFSQNRLCSDSFKLLYYFLNETEFQVYPMNENYGLTLIKLPATKVYPQNIYKDVTYQQFANFMRDKKLYTQDEIRQMFYENNI